MTATVANDSHTHSNYVLKGGNTGLGAAFKMTFYSGSGGSTFGANHYSMGVDYANNAWSNPNYSDLIIGYHTGIRIGAAYGGVKFYNNSPTTDADNDGEGDGSEDLIMTVAGVNGGTGVKVENTLTATTVIATDISYGNASSRAPIFYDKNNTAYYTDPASTSVMATINTVNIHNSGWFRNNTNGHGLYNTATGQHFYSDDDDYWNIALLQTA